MSDMEKAREIAGAVAGQVCDNADAAAVETLAARLIATALAEEREAGRREGMRRAAEIVRAAGKPYIVNTDTGSVLFRTAADKLARAILAEAGIAVTD